MNFSTPAILREAVNFLPIIGNFTSYATEKKLESSDMTDPKVVRAAQILKIANVVRSIATIALLVASVACPLFAAVVVPFWIVYCASDVVLAGWKFCNRDVSKLLELGRAGVTAVVIGLAMHAMPFFAIGVEGVKLINRVVMLCFGTYDGKIAVQVFSAVSTAPTKSGKAEIENSPVGKVLKLGAYFTEHEKKAYDRLVEKVKTHVGNLQCGRLALRLASDETFRKHPALSQSIGNFMKASPEKQDAFMQHHDFKAFVGEIIGANSLTIYRLVSCKASDPYYGLLATLG